MPYIMQKQLFPPAWMGADPVGLKSLLSEVCRGSCAGFATDAFGFRLQNQGVNLWCVAAFGLIAPVVHALGQGFTQWIDAEPDDLMASVCSKCLQDVALLAREVLMNKEETHH